MPKYDVTVSVTFKSAVAHDIELGTYAYGTFTTSINGSTVTKAMSGDIVKVDTELGLIAVRGAIPGPKGGVVFVKNTVKVHKVKQAGAGISNNPQKASARVNPQKASARNK